MNAQMVKNQQLFKKQWDTIYHSKDAKLIMVGNIDGYKTRKEAAHYIVFNKTRAEKRDKAIDKKDRSVFMPFDPLKFNFCNISNKQVIFHVNLDQEAVISKQQAHKITQKFFDKEQGDEDDQIQAHTHPLIINTAPVCKYHSLLAMYPDEQLPQVVGSDIILLLLNIFKILPNSKVGYNSIGAAASVNNLHFHILYSQELIQSNKMPIENAQRKNWLKSSLINPKQQINLYSVGVCIDEISSHGVLAFVVKPYKKQNQTLQFAQLTNSLSFVFGIIANQLIELNIPHNLLFSDNGESIYIFIRDFDERYGWLEFSGVFVATDQKQFQIKQAQIVSKKKSLQIEAKTIEIFKANIKKHLSKFI